MLSEFADPREAPEVLRVREQIRSWRFYGHIRTDAAAPARASQVGTRTPVMSHDGADVAAALQTIREAGDAAARQHHRADQGLRRDPRGRPGAARRASVALAEAIAHQDRRLIRCS
jgi:predicted ATPase